VPRPSSATVAVVQTTVAGEDYQASAWPT